MKGWFPPKTFIRCQNPEYHTLKNHRQANLKRHLYVLVLGFFTMLYHAQKMKCYTVVKAREGCLVIMYLKAPSPHLP